MDNLKMERSGIQRRSPSSSAEHTIIGPRRRYACQMCQQRKVKCDRQAACMNCQKGGVRCVYKEPAPPKRGKRRPADTILAARLRQAEELLKEHGIHNGPATVTNFDTSQDEHQNDYTANEDMPPRQDSIPFLHSLGTKTPSGRLVTAANGSKHKYVESDIWTAIHDQTDGNIEDTLDSSEEDDDSATEDGMMFLGQSVSNIPLRHLHPEHWQVSVLWQAYCSNVDPLVKFVHVPTMKDTIDDAFRDNLFSLSKSTEALMFSIYSIAVLSMQDVECEQTFGESQSTLLDRYRGATREALAKGGYLRSADIRLLQAYGLHLASLRPAIDLREMWIFTGTALRMAQRLGLHRDNANAACSPFEAEMRRRLIWYLLWLDGHAGIVTGAAQPGTTVWIDLSLPANVDDSVLHPSMTDVPQDQQGPTDMMIFMIRCEIGQHFRRMQKSRESGSPDYETVDSRLARIDEVEMTIQDKYLRYCDPVNPRHLLCLLMARTAIRQVRLATSHPRNLPDGGISMPRDRRDKLFNLSLEMLEVETVASGNPSMRRFMWNAQNQVQWTALVYVLTDLRLRPGEVDRERAWRLIEQVFNNHNEMYDAKHRPLVRAISTLILTTWHDIGRLPEPVFITRLKTAQMKRKKTNTDEVMFAEQPQAMQPTPPSDMFLMDNINMDFDPIDWTQWDQLVQDYGLAPTANGGF